MSPLNLPVIGGFNKLNNGNAITLNSVTIIKAYRESRNDYKSNQETTKPQRKPEYEETVD